MNTFKSIVITNVTYQEIVATLAYSEENVKKADQMACVHNVNKPNQGHLSVHYSK